MRVLLATYGSRGDVEPMAALAVELQKLGVDVRLCAPPDDEFVELIEGVGVPLVPFEKTWRSWATRPSTAEERVVSVDEFVAEHIDATYDVVAAAAEGCDLLVASGMLHFVAGSVAEKVGIPHRFVVFSRNLLTPQPWQEPARAQLNVHRASIGLGPVGDVFEFLFTEEPWVAADPILAQQDDPAAVAVVQTPAWILPDQRPLPADLAAFLDAGPPPVYVGFGSMRVSEDSARVAIKAVRSQGCRVLLARGWSDLAPIDDGEDCLAIGEVNQQELFGRVAAVIHHGGAGTTNVAARAGAPQIVVPQAADQFHWAGRVAELGIGSAHAGPIPSFESLRAALRDALAPETRSRATALADLIRTDGAALAAKQAQKMSLMRQ